MLSSGMKDDQGGQGDHKLPEDDWQRLAEIQEDPLPSKYFLGFSQTSVRTTSPANVAPSSADDAVFSHRADSSAAKNSTVTCTNETGHASNYNSFSPLPIADNASQLPKRMIDRWTTSPPQVWRSSGQELGSRAWLGCPENARDLLHSTPTPEKHFARGGKLGTRSKLPVCVTEYQGLPHGAPL